MSIDIIIIISVIISSCLIIYICFANINKDKFNCYKTQQSQITYTSSNNDDLDIQIIIDANNKYKKEDELELL